MAQSRILIPALLDRLEAVYGPQEPGFPLDPYEFLVWWHCGYPASDLACCKGWERLKREIGIDARQLLEAKPAKLAAPLREGGMLPELRAERLKEIAMRIKDEFGGDLRAALGRPVAKARGVLKSFPGIADPGADRILLFAGIAPVAAVPSNCVHVLERILKGSEGKNYTAAYRDVRRSIATEVPEKFDARTRAYLLLKTHGQETCKRTKPKCEKCAVNSVCAYFTAS